MSPGYKPLPLSPRLTIKLMNEEDDSSNSSSSSTTSSSSSSSANTGTSESVGSISSTSSYSSTYSASGKRHIFGSKKKGETNVVKRRRPSEDPGKTAEREYKSIWKNKEQIFRALERIEEISNSIQYEEGDIIGFTEEIEWLLEQIAQKGKNMLGSSSTVAQLEAQQLIVDLEGASYTERNNGFLREIFENEVRAYERLGSIFNAVIDTADELDEGTALWIEQTKEGVLTELELAQKSLTSILSKKKSSSSSSSAAGGRKGSRKKPVLLRHESFIVKENTPVDQPPVRGVLQRQISVPHLKIPQKNFEAGQPKYKHKASSSTVSRASIQLNNELDVTVFSPNRNRQNSDSKGASNRLFINPPSPPADAEEKRREKEREREREKERETEKKKKKKQKAVKESDGKQSDSSRGSESRTDTSPGKDNSAREDEQREKKSPLTRSKSEDSKKAKGAQAEEAKTRPRKLKTSTSKTDLSEDAEGEEHRAQQQQQQQPKKDRDEEASDDFGDDGALDSEQDGKGHKMRSRFSKLAQVFHKSKKAPKPGSATQSPIVRPRASSPQPSDTPSGLSASSYQLQDSLSPPLLSLPPSALGSGLGSAENSVASPTQEQQQESIFKAVMIKTLVTLGLTSKDLRSLYAMDDKTFIEYYESKILVVKEKLDGKRTATDLL